MAYLPDTISRSLEKVVNMYTKTAQLSWDVRTTKREEPLQYKNATVAFGDDFNIRVSCDIADSDESKVIGLQRHEKLDKFAGMVFPFIPARNVRFHMGSVKFPIDIVFVTNGKVARIDKNVEPKTAGTFGHSNVSAVIEVPGGFCDEHNVKVGTKVFEIDDTINKNASKWVAPVLPAFKNMETGKIYISPAGHGPGVLEILSPEEYKMWDEQPASADMNVPGWEDGAVDGDGKWLTHDDYEEYKHSMSNASKIAQETFGGPRKDNNPQMLPVDPQINNEDRFRGNDLIDKQVNMNPVPGIGTVGNDPMGLHDRRDDDPEAPAPVRPAL